MARPQKERKVCPGIQGYCFRGNDDSQPVEIPVDELEALRLCDLEERSQETAAAEMEISRGTLQRLLYSAHRKIAFALLYGKTIQTEGKHGSETGCRRRFCRFCAETTKSIAQNATVNVNGSTLFRLWNFIAQKYIFSISWDYGFLIKVSLLLVVLIIPMRDLLCATILSSLSPSSPPAPTS